MSDFKIASAFVDVRAEDNTGPGLDKAEASVKRWSNKAGNVIEVDFQKTGERAGTKLSEGMGRTFERDAGGRFKSVGEKTGAKLSEGLSKEFEKDGRGRFKKIGAALGITFFSGMVKDASKWMGRTFDGLPGIAKTAGITAGVIVGVAAAPLVGAAIGGALLAAAAGPFLGLGIMQALNDDSVASARDELGDKMGATLKQAGTEFVPVVRDSFHTLSDAWDDIAPQIREGFRAAVPYVSQLTQGVADLAHNAMPGFLSAAKAAGPVFGALKEGLGAIGTSIGDMFGDLSKHGKQAGAAIEVTMHLIAGAIEFAGATLGWLLDKFESMTKMGAGAMHWAQEWLSWLPLVGSGFEKNAAILDHLNRKMSGEEPEVYGRKLKSVGEAADSTTLRANALKERTEILGQSMSDAANTAKGLAGAINQVNAAAMTGEQAELKYQAALDAATESQKKHGKELNADSEAGRANRQALLDLASASNARVAAVYESTRATQGEEAAQKAASAAAQQGRDALAKQAMQFGMSRTEAEKYAYSLTKVPGEVKTTININALPERDRVEMLKASIAGLTGKTVTIKVKADLPPGISMGMLQHQANGGIMAGSVQMFASGGMHSENHVAQIAPAGAWRVWAEPETGGEAYIPLSSSKRGRSVEVLRRTNDLLGSPLADPSAMGAVAVAAPTMSGPTFHFAPGSVVLDASRIKSVQDLLDLFATIKTTARQFGGGRPVAWGGVQ